MKKYKVRIKQAPQMNMGGFVPQYPVTPEMAYGGQTGFGLDLNSRRVYTDMPTPSSESIGRTLAPVNREDATYEAERNEVLVGDLDKDGMHEMLTYGGKPHSQGGTPANKEGFIFSNTKGMRIGGPALEEFGKAAGKKYTPAELAKQYDLNRYKGVIDDPNADPITKRTAEMMIENYNKKLGKLAIVQESMKGKPVPEFAYQANPALAEKIAGVQERQAQEEEEQAMMMEQEQMMMAAYGGHMYSHFQNGGTAADLKRIKTVAKLAKNPKDYEGYNVMGEEDGRKYYGKSEKYKIADAVPGSYVNGRRVDGGRRGNFGVDDILNNAGKYKTFHQLTQGMPEAERRAAAENLHRRGIMPGKYVPGKPEQWGTRDSYYYTENPVEAAATTPVTEGPKLNLVSGQKPVTQATPTKSRLPYNAFDKANLFSALATPVKSYGPRAFLPDVQEMQGYYDQADYNPLLSQANTRMQMNNTFGNTGAAMAANSYNPELTQGILAETQRARQNNLQTANAIAQGNTGIRNQSNAMNAQLMQDNYDKWVKTQEETDIAEKLKWRKDVMPAAQNMVNNRINMERYNMMYPEYGVRGNFWENIEFQQGHKLGSNPQPTGNQPTMDQFISANPHLAEISRKGTNEEKLKVAALYQTWLKDRTSMLGKNPMNVRGNMQTMLNPLAAGYFGQDID